MERNFQRLRGLSLSDVPVERVKSAQFVIILHQSMKEFQSCFPLECRIKTHKIRSRRVFYSSLSAIVLLQAIFWHHALRKYSCCDRLPPQRSMKMTDTSRNIDCCEISDEGNVSKGNFDAKYGNSMNAAIELLSHYWKFPLSSRERPPTKFF